jgi:GNAT superfamily N-acetyltransferase
MPYSTERRFIMDKICYFENNLILRDYDVEKINNLLKQLSPNTKGVTSRDIREVRENSFIFFAVSLLHPEGSIVGMATLTRAYKPTAFFGTMEDVVVDETHRRLGIGTALIDRLVRKAAQLGMKYVDFTSNPKRVEANKRYVALGAKKRSTNIYRFEL